MIADVVTVMGKEWKEIMAMGGAQRGRFQLLIFIGMLGVFLPLQMGTTWVTSPGVVAIWGWLPVLMVSTIVADSFAGERERHTLETLLASRLSDDAILFGKMGAAVAYGWGLTMVALLVGLVTVNIAHRDQGLILYAPLTAIGGFVVSLLGGLLASAVGVLVSLRAQTVRQAQQTMSIATMVVFFVPLGVAKAVPAGTRVRVGEWLVGAGALKLVLLAVAIVSVIDLLLILAARARFRRAKLATG
jgi:ABC-2 type transport system permease protein